MSAQRSVRLIILAAVVLLFAAATVGPAEAATLALNGGGHHRSSWMPVIVGTVLAGSALGGVLGAAYLVRRRWARGGAEPPATRG
jgi:hypothetical protein